MENKISHVEGEERTYEVARSRGRQQGQGKRREARHGGRVVETGQVTGKNHVAGIQCRHENTARKLSDRERWWSCLTGLGDLIKRLDLFYRQKGGLAARLSG